MNNIVECKTEADFAVAAKLIAELGGWDSAEAEKLGFSAQDIFDFYYSAGTAQHGTDTPCSEVTLLGYADAETEAGGCVAYREMEPAICELKRLYVRPRFRRTGLGRALVSSLISRARAAHYKCIRLETVSFMGAAIRMYEAMGFARRAPYYDIPALFLPITIFMEKNLDGPEVSAIIGADRGE